jgi:hypothetical protein
MKEKIIDILERHSFYLDGIKRISWLPNEIASEINELFEYEKDHQIYPYLKKKIIRKIEKIK